jgi:hypothetical protein
MDDLPEPIAELVQELPAMPGGRRSPCLLTAERALGGDRLLCGGGRARR